MANRNQNYPSDNRRSSESQGGYGSQSDYGYDRDDDNRFAGGNERNYDRDYGDYRSGNARSNEPRGGYGNVGQARYGQGGYGEDYGSSGTSQYGRSSFGSNRQQDWGGSQGQHRGKGPKGFQRSDERIKELICERLSEDPHVDASEITVDVQGGKVTLEGSVDSRQTKNAAEDIAEQYSQDVQNNLRVSRQGGESQWGSSAKSMGAGAGSGAMGKAGVGTEESDASTRLKRN